MEPDSTWRCTASNARGNWHKLQAVKIPIKQQDKANYYNECGETLEQVAQKGCEISILRYKIWLGKAMSNLGVSKSDSTLQLALLWVGSWTTRLPKIHSNPNYATTLSFYLSKHVLTLTEITRTFFSGSKSIGSFHISIKLNIFVSTSIGAQQQQCCAIWKTLINPVLLISFFEYQWHKMITHFFILSPNNVFLCF